MPGWLIALIVVGVFILSAVWVAVILWLFLVFRAVMQEWRKNA